MKKRGETVIDASWLIEVVINWGEEHNLHDPIMQFAKVNEEVGEIAHELTRNHLDTPEIKDAIGDSLVTLIILSNILGFDPVDCLAAAYEEIRDRKGITENGTFVKEQ